MKKSFISILVLTLVMVLAISAVSAAEDSDASDSVIQSQDDVPVDEVAADQDVLKASDDDSAVADADEGNSFASLQSQADSNDVITSDKTTPILNVSSVSVNEFGMIVVHTNITKGATGNVTYLFANMNTGKNSTAEIPIEDDGSANYDEMTPFEKGFYKITVGYKGDDNYGPAVDVIKETDVTKTVPELDVYSVSVNEYGMIVVLANITKGATGNVTYLFTNTDTDENFTVEIPIENGTANYDEMTIFNKTVYKINVWYKGDENYYATPDDIEEANVTKTAPLLDVYSVSVNEFGMIVVRTNITKGATGNVTYLFINMDTDKNLTVEIPVEEDGTADYNELTPFEKGYYSINVRYNGDDNYYATVDAKDEINVTKTAPELDVYSVTVNEYGMIVVLTNITKGATGNVTYLFTNTDTGENLTVEIPIENGTANYDEMTIFNKTVYKINVWYKGDENYYATPDDIEEANVTKTVPVLDVYNVTVNNYGMIVVLANITKGATGNVTYLFTNLDTGKNLTVEIPVEEDGTADYDELTPFEKGVYKINVWYNGDHNYYATVDVEEEATLNKTAPLLDVYKVYVNDYGMIVVLANINKGATGNVTYMFTNMDTGANFTVEIPIENGTANYDEMTIFNKTVYKINVWYEGDDNYYPTVDIIEEVNVTKSVPVLDVYNVTVNEYGMIVVLANITKGATGNVTYLFTNLDTGKKITVDIPVDDDGTANYDELTPFEKGYYSINIWYNGDNNYYSTLEDIEETNVTKSLTNPTHTVTVIGGEVNVTVDLGVNATGVLHVVYPSGYVNNVTIVNGKINFYEVFMRETGDMSFVVDYDGDANYYGFYQYYIDFIIKKATFIKAKSQSVVYNDNAKWTISLVDGDLKPVANQYISVSVNGKTYKAKTNSKGNAVVTIPGNFVPKTYAAKITFAGDTYYEKDFDDTLKFTVKKATPKLTAKKKTFKVKKSKKYTVTLKTNKNKALNKVKVTITIKAKGKKIKITQTTKKGKATFNLKKLTKKGKYSAQVKFAGNKFYKAVTKNTKITVR